MVRRVRSLFVWLLALVALLGHARTARADLRSEMATIRRSLQADGASVTVVPSMFLEGDQTRTFEPLALSSASSDDVCVTVILMGARTTLFSVVTSEKSEAVDETLSHAVAEREARQTASVEGFFSVEACRKDVATLERLVLRMRSPRGSVEMLVARSPRALASLDSALLSRAEGPTAPRGDPGGPLTPGPLALRRKNAATRAHDDGALGVIELDMAAGEAGSGEFVLKVGAGCHRFDVMAEVPPTHGIDVDAELRDTDTHTLLAQDRGETPDASVEVCIAKASEVSLRFVGAVPHGRVFLSDGIFNLPTFVPEHWGPRTTAAFSELVKRRIIPRPRVGPITEMLGVQGSTELSVEVEPGRCYLAAVALMRGASRGVRLVASSSARASSEESPPSGDGASVVFCSEDRDRARLTVDAPGSAIWWVLLVWPLGEAGP